MAVRDSNKRINKILSVIIETYINTAKQVSSRYIAKNYDFGLSPATIRNEMAELEEKGYLTHPHTSAGRVPTDEGYRYYIDELIKVQKLTLEDIKEINSHFKVKFKILENIISVTSNLLSDISNQTSLILFPKLDKSTFKHVELIPLKDKKILIVLMTNTGVVKNSIVETDNTITKAQLRKISNFLNYELYDMPLSEIKEHLKKKMFQEKDTLYRLFKDTIDIFSLIFKNIHEDKILMEGMDHILDNPEFKDLEKSRLVFKMLGKKKKLIKFLRQNLEMDTMQVHIGKELPPDMVNDCGIITACYRISNKSIGCLGILGPKRMKYSRLIPFVDYVSTHVSKMITKLEK